MIGFSDLLEASLCLGTGTVRGHFLWLWNIFQVRLVLQTGTLLWLLVILSNILRLLPKYYTIPPMHLSSPTQRFTFWIWVIMLFISWSPLPLKLPFRRPAFPQPMRTTTLDW